MRVSKCPICGRLPKIEECHPFKNKRRRMCFCPNLDSVIPCSDHLNHSWFIYCGDGDDNSIFKLWNAAINRYNLNKEKPWFEKDFSAWTNDIHLERE